MPGADLANCVQVGSSAGGGRAEDDMACTHDVLQELGPNLRLRVDSWWDSQEKVYFRIHYWNLGSVTLQNVTIRDTYPLSTTYNGDLSWLGDEPWITQDAEQRRLVLTLDDVSPAEEGSITLGFDLDAKVIGVGGLAFGNAVEAPIAGDVNPADNADVEVAYSEQSFSQLTTCMGLDRAPSMVHAADGKLWLVWWSDCSGNRDLWYKTTSDGGATWSADVQLTTNTGGNYLPAITQAADGSLWLVWTSDRSGNEAIWYKTSSDGGATWSADTRLTGPEWAYAPSVVQAADGKVWVVWFSDRSGYAAIWYKTSEDGGVTWSADTQFTYSGATFPFIAKGADGKLWLVWGGLTYRFSSDGGTTWSPDVEIPGSSGGDPSLVVADDGTVWLASSRDDDIWYHTSNDGGTTWSAGTQWTRFVGLDDGPAVAALNDGSVAVAWSSNRSGNSDIWFGVFGQHEDVNPPPYVASADHLPGPNPDSDDTVIVRARVVDDTSVLSVDLVWTRNGTPQTDVVMYDDGAHNDNGAGDGWYGAQIGPLPAGEQIGYAIRAMDSDSNSVTAGARSFSVLEPLGKTADILFVADDGPGRDTAWFRNYYAQAFDDGGWSYDLWDVGLRSAPDAAVLNQYTNGVVVWANPSGRGCLGSWYSYCPNTALTALGSYLDSGGHLFVSGQNIGQSLIGSGEFGIYLHAQYVQGNVGLYEVTGEAGDPIGDGLALGISGGDGANNQTSPDEIDPIAPAVTVLRYDSALMPGARAQDSAHAASIASSGTAGLRVDTGTYKVVYFAFGFEAINSRADRAVVMERVLTWLGVALPATLGGVNDDGLVDSTDALIILTADAGLNTSQFCPMNCGDVNADGLVNSTDALIILTYDVGMSVPFPVATGSCPSSITQPPGCSP